VHSGHSVGEGEVLEDALVQQVEPHVQRIPAGMQDVTQVVKKTPRSCLCTG
jgi:hypothetical protein